jgi:hypothetical protein
MATGKFFWIYVQSSGKWQGCDWPTAFGANRLNLNGLRAVQAHLLSEATAGSEGADWRAAAQWLENVERDAKQVEAKTARAAELAEAGQLNEALTLVEEACAMEGRYHTDLVWQPLRQTIATVLAEQRPESTT